MYHKVEICGVNTAKLPVLSEKRKMALLRLAKQGDKKAREELIRGNLRLVLSVIQGFISRGCADDLFQVGCMGLIKAVDHFDLSMDVRFSTYAVPMIVGELRRHLRDDNSVRVSRSVRDLAYRALQVRETLAKSLRREPNTEELAKSLGVSNGEVVQAMDAILEPISLYEPVYNENGDTLYVMDQIADTQNTDEQWITGIALSEAVKKLSEREKRILMLRFYGGKTQTEVSSEIGISQAQVSRLEKAALERIRHEL